MPETDTPFSIQFAPRKTYGEVLWGASSIKESGDALRHPHCESAGVRTQDPILKRDVLYRLSY